jgi:alpha-ribazole phosphatase
MEILLIRHPEPLGARGICYGRSDLELAPGWEQKTVALASQISMPVDFIFSSPARRCIQPARFLYERLLSSLNGGVEVSESLWEFDFGLWENKPWSEIPRSQIDAWAGSPLSYQIPGAESFATFRERVLNWFSGLLSVAKWQRVLVITHGGVMKQILADSLQIPLTEVMSWQIDYGGCRCLYAVDGCIIKVDEQSVVQSKICTAPVSPL